jgi:hypothetical protein
MVDYVLKHKSGSSVSIKVLWEAVIVGFESVWPEHLSGIRRGDVWCFSPLKQIGVMASDMVPFHKLSQWLTYSLLEPIEGMGVKFDGMELMTGLAEYRNGGEHTHVHTHEGIASDACSRPCLQPLVVIVTVEYTDIASVTGGISPACCILLTQHCADTINGN